MKYLITILIIIFQVVLSVALAHEHVRSHSVRWPIILFSYILPILLFASINAVYFKTKYNFKMSNSIAMALMLGILGFLISGSLLTMFFGE